MPRLRLGDLSSCELLGRDASRRQIIEQPSPSRVGRMEAITRRTSTGTATLQARRGQRQGQPAAHSMQEIQHEATVSEPSTRSSGTAQPRLDACYDKFAKRRDAGVILLCWSASRRTWKAIGNRQHAVGAGLVLASNSGPASRCWDQTALALKLRVDDHTPPYTASSSRPRMLRSARVSSL